MAMSYVSFESDGITKQFDLPFGYLSKQHVFCFVNDELRGFKWISGSRIELLVFPPVDAIIKIRRLTERAARVTNFVDGQTLLAGDLNDGDLQAFYILQELIDQLTDGIATGDVSVLNPDGGWITAAWIAEQIDGAAPPEALAALAAAIAAEATARGDDLAAEAAARTAAVLALTDADAAAFDRLDIIESDLNTATTGIKAKIVEYANTLVDLEANKAEASVVSALGVSLSSVEGDITTIEAAATSLESRVTTVETDKAEASALSALDARVGTAEGAITSEQTARSDGDLALSSDITALDARVGTAEAGITTNSEAIATETGARASETAALEASIGDIEADIVTEAAARVSGDAAAASETSSLRTSFSGRAAGGILNGNPFFDEGPTGTGIPARWAEWINGGVLEVVSKPFGGTGLCLRAPATAGSLQIGTKQILSNGSIRPAQKYKLRAEVARGTGTLDAAALLIYWNDAAGTYLGVNSKIVLATEADTSGVISAVGDGRRVWEKEVSAPAGAYGCTVYALTQWAGAGTVQATSPQLYWFEASISTIDGAAARLGTAEADIVTEAATRASADSASATLLTNLRADTQVRGVLNFNPYFDQPTASPGVPAGWQDWIGAAANTTQVSRAVAPLSGLNARTVVPLTTDNVGIQQYLALGGNWAGRYVAMRARVRRHSGANTGAGVYVIFYNADYTVVTGEYVFKFATEPNTSGLVSTAHTGSTTYDKVLKVPTNTYNIRIIAITNYPSVFGTGTVKTLDWHECSISEVGGGVAGVTDLREAISTGSSTSARLLLGVNTTTNVATIEAVAVDGDGTWNGSAISLTASEIRLNGNVVIAGTLTTTELSANAVTNTAVSQTAAAVTMTDGVWTDMASFSFTSVGIGVELRGTVEVTSSGFAGGACGALEYRVLRGATVLKSGTANVAEATTTVSGFPYLTKFAPIISDYNDIPSSGTYTYKLQAKITGNTLTVPILQGANRYLSAREFKR